MKQPDSIHSFHSAYPLALLDAVFTVCIARQGWLPLDPSLPAPSVKGLKPFTEFCGFSDVALRTALSRERKKADLEFFTDEYGIGRLDMASAGQGITRFYHQGLPCDEGLTIAVFQFETAQNRERYQMKEILKSFSFKMFSQNVYVSRKVPHGEILKLSGDAGAGKHLFLFDTEKPRGAALERIKQLYDSSGLHTRYENFLGMLKAYLKADGDLNSVFHRALYAAAAHHLNNRVMLPPLPEQDFAGMAVYKEIDSLILNYYTTHFEDHRKVYMKFHGGKEHEQG